MSDRMEDPRAVVGDLFEEMDRTVKAYGPGVVKVDKCVTAPRFSQRHGSLAWTFAHGRNTAGVPTSRSNDPWPQF
jgi:hypothetical protein